MLITASSLLASAGSGSSVARSTATTPAMAGRAARAVHGPRANFSRISVVFWAHTLPVDPTTRASSSVV